MNKSTSLYLNFLRVIAAFGVVLVHANLPWFLNTKTI
jgi:peptidoglycan/LPS O-acetylase OafA/YrhL